MIRRLWVNKEGEEMEKNMKTMGMKIMENKSLWTVFQNQMTKSSILKLNQLFHYSYWEDNITGPEQTRCRPTFS